MSEPYDVPDAPVDLPQSAMWSPTANHLDAPPEFLDPINEEVMLDPVILADTGNTYERATIERWIRECERNGRKPTDPLTGLALETAKVTPNHTLRNLIQGWASQAGIADVRGFARARSRALGRPEAPRLGPAVGPGVEHQVSVDSLLQLHLVVGDEEGEEGTGGGGGAGVDGASTLPPSRLGEGRGEPATAKARPSTSAEGVSWAVASLLPPALAGAGDPSGAAFRAAGALAKHCATPAGLEAALEADALPLALLLLSTSEPGGAAPVAGALPVPSRARALLLAVVKRAAEWRADVAATLAGAGGLRECLRAASSDQPAERLAALRAFSSLLRSGGGDAARALRAEAAGAGVMAALRSLARDVEGLSGGARGDDDATGPGLGPSLPLSPTTRSARGAPLAQASPEVADQDRPSTSGRASPEREAPGPSAASPAGGSPGPPIPTSALTAAALAAACEALAALGPDLVAQLGRPEALAAAATAGLTRDPRAPGAPDALRALAAGTATRDATVSALLGTATISPMQAWGSLAQLLSDSLGGPGAPRCVPGLARALAADPSFQPAIVASALVASARGRQALHGALALACWEPDVARRDSEGAVAAREASLTAQGCRAAVAGVFAELAPGLAAAGVSGGPAEAEAAASLLANLTAGRGDAGVPILTYSPASSAGSTPRRTASQGGASSGAPGVSRTSTAGSHHGGDSPGVALSAAGRAGAEDEGTSGGPRGLARLLDRARLGGAGEGAAGRASTGPSPREAIARLKERARALSGGTPRPGEGGVRGHVASCHADTVDDLLRLLSMTSALQFDAPGWRPAAYAACVALSNLLVAKEGRAALKHSPEHLRTRAASSVRALLDDSVERAKTRQGGASVALRAPDAEDVERAARTALRDLSHPIEDSNRAPRCVWISAPTWP